jgi:putative PIN family toxin of toxin-antitoxin system
MTDSNRFVADTNVLLSRAMFRNSTPSQALRHATSVSRLIVSIETLEELQDVLFRSKFDTYINLNDRLSFFESVPPVSACRDPEDDKFLALALTGHAEFILTGDQDLLSLHPFQGIDILSPRQYLDRQQT